MGDRVISNRGRIGLLLGLLLVSGCQRLPRPVPAGTAVVAVETRAATWTTVASQPDQVRISRLGVAWSTGLSEARARGFGSAIRAEGKLLEPRAGLSRPAPTPGSYRCRMVSLGRSASKGPAFERFKPFFCYVDLEGDLFTIVKQTGTQRPAGRLWEDDVPTRMIFLGSLALGDNAEAVGYGDDPKRDMAGVFERIAPFRWRLVIPFPLDGSRINVFELVPVPEQPGP